MPGLSVGSNGVVSRPKRNPDAVVNEDESVKRVKRENANGFGAHVDFPLDEQVQGNVVAPPVSRMLRVANPDYKAMNSGKLLNGKAATGGYVNGKAGSAKPGNGKSTTVAVSESGKKQRSKSGDSKKKPGPKVGWKALRESEGAARWLEGQSGKGSGSAVSNGLMTHGSVVTPRSPGDTLIPKPIGLSSKPIGLSSKPSAVNGAPLGASGGVPVGKPQSIKFNFGRGYGESQHVNLIELEDDEFPTDAGKNEQLLGALLALKGASLSEGELRLNELDPSRMGTHEYLLSRADYGGQYSDYGEQYSDSTNNGDFMDESDGDECLDGEEGLIGSSRYAMPKILVSTHQQTDGYDVTIESQSASALTPSEDVVNPFESLVSLVHAASLKEPVAVKEFLPGEENWTRFAEVRSLEVANSQLYQFDLGWDLIPSSRDSILFSTDFKDKLLKPLLAASGAVDKRAKSITYYLVRHGQYESTSVPNGNAKKHILTALGNKQVEATRDYLSTLLGGQADACLSSTMTRAVLSAGVIFDPSQNGLTCAIPWHQDSLLSEDNPTPGSMDGSKRVDQGNQILDSKKKASMNHYRRFESTLRTFFFAPRKLTSEGENAAKSTKGGAVTAKQATTHGNKPTAESVQPTTESVQSAAEPSLPAKDPAKPSRKLVAESLKPGSKSGPVRSRDPKIDDTSNADKVATRSSSPRVTFAPELDSSSVSEAKVEVVVDGRKRKARMTCSSLSATCSSLGAPSTEELPEQGGLKKSVKGSSAEEIPLRTPLVLKVSLPKTVSGAGSILNGTGRTVSKDSTSSKGAASSGVPGSDGKVSAGSSKQSTSSKKSLTLSENSATNSDEEGNMDISETEDANEAGNSSSTSSDVKDDTRVVIVGHGNVIRFLVARLLQQNPFMWLRMNLRHGSVTTIRIFRNGAVLLLGLGEASHMNPSIHSQ